MIMGIGTDLCRISRIKKAIQKGGFVEKIFSQEEIAYAAAQGDPAKHFASAFAAKEALAKASGWGIFGTGLRSSWVIRTKTGPVIAYDDRLARKFKESGIERCWLSLSHEGDFALAFVVLES